MKNMQEDSDLTNTVQVSARRFEESPFIERTNSPDMIRGVYADRYFAIYLGENVDDKYWTLRQKALIFDVPEKPLEISGPGALVFFELEKGDFIGREALTGKDRRSLLFGLTCQTVTPSSGSVIIFDNQAVGTITAGVPSLTLGCGIGYARFKEPADWVGKTVLLQLADGSEHTAQIVQLPFVDPEKNIVRGTDRTIPERTGS